jgi:photosystem II stability/assembly factor-like uncharacterized protein
MSEFDHLLCPGFRKYHLSTRHDKLWVYLENREATLGHRCLRIRAHECDLSVHDDVLRDGGGYGDAIDCPSVTTCVSVGESGLLSTTDSWTTWTSNSNFGLFSAVACPSTNECFATASTGSSDSEGGGAIVATTDSGRSWTAKTYTPFYGGLDGIDCPSRSTCYAGDNDTLSDQTIPGAILATVDAGRTWANQPLPTSIGPLTEIACPTTTVCYAVADTTDPTGTFGQGDFFATSDGGDSWSSKTLPMNGSEPTGLACPSILTCYFISVNSKGKPQILTTFDGGKTWRLHAIDPPIQNLGPIACLSTTICYAVGDGVILTTDAGTTWKEQPTPIQNRWFTDIVCPSTTTCYAVGFGDIIATSDSGRTWRRETLPSRSDPPEGIACTSTTACVIVGNVLFCLLGENDPCPPQTFSTLSTTDSGANWIGHSLPKDVNPISVTCTSAFVCYATTIIGPPEEYDSGEAGGILTTTNLGSTWSVQTVPPETGPISTVTCPSESVCYAVGNGTGDIGGLILKAGNLR